MPGLDELEDYLRNALILGALDPPSGGGGHSGGRFRLLLHGGVSVIAKPGTNPDSEAMMGREAAAWQIARLLGFEDIVAATVVRPIPTRDGDEVLASAQVFWPDGNLFSPPIDTFPDEDVWRAAVFDAVIGNVDRGGHNWLAVPAPGGPVPPRLTLVDHGHAFDYGGNRERVESAFYAAHRGEDIPEDLLEALQRFVAAWPPAPVRDLLSPEAIEGVELRAQRLVQRGVLAI